MQRPETRYAKSGDVNVAYQVTGEGNPFDLVYAPGTVSHVDLDWDWPGYGPFLEELSAFCRLIRFDKRGTGLSDRVTDVATLEERTDDIRAVMDAVGSERATILGDSEGANMACLFAATYPPRTRSLIVWGGQARWIATDDYPWGITADENERMIARLAAGGIDAEYLSGFGAGLGDTDPVELEFALRYAKASASPAAAAALERMNTDIDVRDILPSIRVPTLVMNRVDDPVANVQAAQQLASSVPGARFVTFPGAAHGPTGEAQREIVAEIQEFVTGVRPIPQEDRVLATVMFTDIVSSTERLADLGDERWKRLLASHHGKVRQALTRFRGREVDTAGDGFFATFDGPARAVRCGRTIAAEVQSLGLQIRAGVHTGECELMGDDVRGIAVHIGARVAALAAAGEVLVSSTVKDLVAGSGLVFDDRGTHTLKGVPDEWHLYSVVGDRS